MNEPQLDQVTRQRLERERLAREAAEREHLARLERERLAREAAERERLERERLERERERLARAEAAVTKIKAAFKGRRVRLQNRINAYDALLAQINAATTLEQINELTIRINNLD